MFALLACASALAPATTALAPATRLPLARHTPCLRPRCAPPRLAVDGERPLDLPTPALLKAIARCGGSVTAADVAAESGQEIAETRRQLLNLARIVGADLQVSGVGEVLFVFPEPGAVRRSLRTQSVRQRGRDAWEAGSPALFWLLRASFGLGLIASLSLATAAIVALVGRPRAAMRAVTTSPVSPRHSLEGAVPVLSKPRARKRLAAIARMMCLHTAIDRCRRCRRSHIAIAIAAVIAAIAAAIAAPDPRHHSLLYARRPPRKTIRRVAPPPSPRWVCSGARALSTFSTIAPTPPTTAPPARKVCMRAITPPGALSRRPVEACLGWSLRVAPSLVLPPRVVCCLPACPRGVVCGLPERSVAHPHVLLPVRAV